MNRHFIGDLYYYALSVIIPGAISFFSVPVLKSMLGASDFGYYSLWMNAFLITTGSSIGWIATSIVRFRSAASNPLTYFRQVIKIVTILSVVLAVCCVLVLGAMGKPAGFILVFAAALIASVYQNACIAFAQGSFMAKRTVLTESLRIIVFFTLAVLLLSVSTNHFDIRLFFATAVSYSVSTFFLFQSIRRKLANEKNDSLNESTSQIAIQDLLHYGWPLFFWTLAYSLIPYLDKLLVAEKYGNELLGNYQAVFDLVYKTLLTLLNPILLTALPHFSRMHVVSDLTQVRQIMKKLIAIELLLASLCLLGYYFIGAKWLHQLAKVPHNSEFIGIGMVSVVAAFAWHIAMLLHKPLEMARRTKVMMYNILISLLSTAALLIPVFYYWHQMLLFPVSILFGAVVYIILCLFSLAKMQKV
ncbi:lipopolysaccharide biosynthesis protein [Phnomibacter sp. MR]|uniref:lipopolysaccharide biosynthesis protein n=1 Tax=Phnomibacter sp. MR TaxID=3042318 RepID=UPI003A810915